MDISVNGPLRAVVRLAVVCALIVLTAGCGPITWTFEEPTPTYEPAPTLKLPGVTELTSAHALLESTHNIGLHFIAGACGQ
jgi:hypothetical protein